MQIKKKASFLKISDIQKNLKSEKSYSEDLKTKEAYLDDIKRYKPKSVKVTLQFLDSLEESNDKF